MVKVHGTSAGGSGTGVLAKPKIGRPKLYPERIVLPLPAGTTARIDALLEDDEYRLDFIRAAIEAEVEKRVASKPVRKRGGKAR
jgi:hypothetical protein